MMATKTLSPRSSLILVMDSSAGEIPASMGNSSITSTRSCVAVGTLAEMDGETAIILTDSVEGIELGDLVFDGLLMTPGREMSVCSVEDEKLLTIPLASSEARVRIFTNDSNEPDRVVVLVEDPLPGLKATESSYPS